MGKASARKKREAELRQLLNQDRPSTSLDIALPTAVPSADRQSPQIPTLLASLDATTAPPPIPAQAAVETAKPHRTEATPAGALTSFIAGDFKPLASRMLLVGVTLWLVFSLWMMKIDNDWGRLTTMDGYIQCGYKALGAMSLLVVAVLICALGYLLFGFVSYLKRLLFD